MGRHADPDDSSFYRSLGTSIIMAAAVAGVLLALVLVVAWLSLRETGPTDSTVVLGEQVTEPDRPVTAEPTPTGESVPEDDQPAAGRSDDVEDAKPPAETSVQVLDGVGDAELTQHVIDTLTSRGYRIAAVNPSVRDYEQTTVFYTEGYEPEARLLRREDARFGKLRPNRGLAESVDLHVVIGADWTQ